ncbi:MAG: hypothetical protein FWE03_03580 [Firmicutes bacterium]|nr:hypothetical protein [Bacillota bacterium]
MAFSDKLTLDEANQKILHENRQEVKIGGFGLFKNVITKKFWITVKINWLVLVFALPLIVWIFFWQMRVMQFNVSLPYSSSIGIGYPIIPNLPYLSNTARFSLALNRALVMIPLIALACVGLAGAFNVMKYVVWGMEIKIIKTFFKGIKNSFLSFIWMGVILALCFFMMTSFVFVFDVNQISVAVKVIMLIVGSIISLFAIIMTLFVFTQSSMFNLSMLDMIKNAFWLSIKFILQNIFIALTGVLIIAFVFIPSTGGFLGMLLTMMGFILFFMFAFSWMAAAYTIYSHFIFDALYDSKRKDEDKKGESFYDNDDIMPANPQKKKQKQVYINPKKGKKRNSN